MASPTAPDTETASLQPSWSTVRSYLLFARRYPAGVTLSLVSLVVATALEGLSAATIISLLPILLGMGEGGGVLEEAVSRTLAVVGFTPSVLALVTILFVASVGKSVLTYVALTLAGNTSAQVATDMRLDILNSMLRAKWSYFVRQPVGRSANAVTIEAYRAAQVFLWQSRAIAAAMLACLYGLVAFLVSWQVSLLAISGIALLAFSLRGLVKRARKAGAVQTNSSQTLVTDLTRAFSGLKAVKAMAREERFAAMFEHETMRLWDAHRQQVRYQALMQVVTEPVMVIVIIVGLLLALEYSSLNIAGILVFAYLSLRLMQRALVAQAYLQRAALGEASLWSLVHQNEQSAAEREATWGSEAPTLAHNIVFRDLSFSFGEQKVLANLNLTVPAHSFTVVHGPSGTGKTTLIDLLVGLHRPQGGEILIDGVPLSRIELRQWRRSIGYVPQESYLFHDTVQNNVSMGDPNVSAADVETALRAAGAWDFIAPLPAGMQTMVGEGGGRFSGGQKQRIAIARALASKPLLLVLDEATSGLDPSTEQGLLATAKAVSRIATVIAISHQESVADAADVAYRLSDGTVVLDVRPALNRRAAVGGSGGA